MASRAVSSFVSLTESGIKRQMIQDQSAARGGEPAFTALTCYPEIRALDAAKKFDQRHTRHSLLRSEFQHCDPSQRQLASR